MKIDKGPMSAAAIADEDLRTVAGGMSCDKAQAMAKFYIALGDIEGNVFGSSAGAAANYGKAQGLLEGACGR